MRFITEITKENLADAKGLMGYAEVRHMEGIRGNFSASDKEYLAISSINRADDLLPQIIYSNAKEIVQQHQYLFETLWNRARPAEQKIRELEEGAEPEFFEVIYDSGRASELLLSLSRSARKEVLLILTNDRSLLRIDKLGLIDEFQKAAAQGTSVRIICPITDVNSHIIKRLGPESRIEFSRGNASQFGVMIIDPARFIGAEMVNPGAEKFSDAIGITIYSNSRRTASMLRSFFESLWRQTQLYEQLESANKKLEMHDMMQREFVNVASHELRTPITPILVSLYLGKRVKNDDDDGTMQVVLTGEQAEMIERNAKRLEKLATEILEVARIESRGMSLQKERVDLNQKV
ncbi:MAG: histidine kinase dimerization/phospho-acceptor domain-containing protein [Nitrososphaera sp.]|jgi:signal transduction histidine kinase